MLPDFLTYVRLCNVNKGITNFLLSYDILTINIFFNMFESVLFYLLLLLTIVRERQNSSFAAVSQSPYLQKCTNYIRNQFSLKLL